MTPWNTRFHGHRLLSSWTPFAAPSVRQWPFSRTHPAVQLQAAYCHTGLHSAMTCANASVRWS
jgi:hypothetical protein